MNFNNEVDRPVCAPTIPAPFPGSHLPPTPNAMRLLPFRLTKYFFPRCTLSAHGSRSGSSVNPALSRIDLAEDTAWKGVGEEWMNEISSFAYARCVAVNADMAHQGGMSASDSNDADQSSTRNTLT
jgi:hypothetical protein